MERRGLTVYEGVQCGEHRSLRATVGRVLQLLGGGGGLGQAAGLQRGQGGAGRVVGAHVLLVARSAVLEPHLQFGGGGGGGGGKGTFVHKCVVMIICKLWSLTAAAAGPVGGSAASGGNSNSLHRVAHKHWELALQFRNRTPAPWIQLSH